MLSNQEPGVYAVSTFGEIKNFHDIADFRLGGEYDYSDMDSCRMGGRGGVTLESLGAGPLRCSWIEIGTRHLDSAGQVDNAILMFPYYSGDSSNMLDFWHADGGRTDFCMGAHIGPGKLLDTDKYCIFLFDALGLWGSSKPSSSRPGDDSTRSLGLNFPKYRVEDCVQTIYLTLKEHIGIGRVKLVTGVSFGATMSFCMAALHPEFMETVLPIGGTVYQNRGMLRWLFDLATSAIQSDPVYRETAGDYYHLPLLERPALGNMFAWSILKQSAFVDEYRVTQSHEQYVTEAFDWELSAQTLEQGGTEPGYSSALHDISRSIDANDLIYRNICQSMYSIEEHLHRVKARTLIIHVSTDQWIRCHLAETAARGIVGSQLITFEHDFGHYAVFRAPALLQPL